MANHYITMLNLLLTSKQRCESVYKRNGMEYREYMYTKTGELNNLLCGIKKKNNLTLPNYIHVYNNSFFLSIRCA